MGILKPAPEGPAEATGDAGRDAPRHRSRWRARAQARAWSRIEVVSLACLLGATALLYIVGLDASGYANEFYSAAAQAGSTNWWSFLWGSSDAGNSITVDKPPAAIWPMALAVRVFGLSSWSILVPQAIMGVLSVWLLYSIVRRAWGHWPGILAGAALATTPIACLMFRFNNPDALLMLLLESCVYCVLRACELPDGREANRSRTRWMALAGVAMGFAFLTKQLQAFLILPGIGVAFLVASPTSWRRKLLDTLAAFGALAVSAGWWVLLTVLVPASDRPYIGGSQTNSFIELTFSYNGLGRITGSMEGAVLPGGSSTTISQGQAGMWGQTGITRLFDGVWGTQWSWLAWVALAGIVVGLVCERGKGRQSLRRSNVIAWGLWLVVTGLVFSFMGGTIHQYYTVALAPATAALFAICVASLWERRGERWAQATALGLVAATAVWSTVLLERADWLVPLRLVVLGLGVAAIVVALVAWGRLGVRKAPAEGEERDTAAGAPAGAAGSMPGEAGTAVVVAAVPVDEGADAGARRARLERVALGLALASALAGPVAYSLYTAATGHTGSIVTAGPSAQDDSGMGGGMGGGPGQGGTDGQQGGPGQDSMAGVPGGMGSGSTGGSSDGSTSSDGTSSDGGSTGAANGGSDGMPTPPSGGMGQGTGGSAPTTTGGTGSTTGMSPMGMPGGATGVNTDGTTANGSSGTDGSASGTAPTAGDGSTSGSASQATGADGSGQQAGQPGGGGAGGLLGGGSVSDELVEALEEDAGSYRWVAATVGSQNAASYQLATQCSVMPIGGFNGSDPSPTLDQFKEWVAEGQIHYFIASGGVGGGTQIGGSDVSSQITAWVEENYTATTIGDVTVYDLTASSTAAA